MMLYMLPMNRILVIVIVNNTIDIMLELFVIMIITVNSMIDSYHTINFPHNVDTIIQKKITLPEV